MGKKPLSQEKMKKRTVRQILVFSDQFRSFWEKRGPYKYALTSREFPPVLLEPEEWIFSDGLTELLKELMQWDKRKMKLVKAPFSKKTTAVLKPDSLSPWRIKYFPKEWETSVCNAFTPVGHLTEAVVSTSLTDSKKEIESAFFNTLGKALDTIGYTLLKPTSFYSNDEAYVDEYLKEWEADE